MSQKTINVGTVANDGTGDTIRGAFTNVNANFTEVYSNLNNLTAIVAGIDLGQNATIQASYSTANAAFDNTNTVNSMVYSVAVSSNAYTDTVSSSINAYAVVIGTSGNAYTLAIGSASNSYAQIVGTAGNSYTSILAANNAAGANDWSNTLTTTTYSWANSKFDTVVNTTMILNMANAAYIRANNSLANTANASNGSVTLVGSLTVTGTLTDAIGPLREKLLYTVAEDHIVLKSEAIVIANNSNTISIKIPNDGEFLLPANIGTTVEVYQFGSGNTKIIANDGTVLIRSTNNWSNISGQYLTASVVKVLPNTWMLFGNLKA